MSDGWIEIVEGEELPEMGEPVLVSGWLGGYVWYAVANIFRTLDGTGNFGGLSWFEDITETDLGKTKFVPLRWREIPR